jgi:hypothetical protein
MTNKISKRYQVTENHARDLIINDKFKKCQIRYLVKI